MFIFSSKNKKAPRAFIIALAIILILEGLILRFEHYIFEDIENRTMVKLKVSLSNLPVHFDVLFFGDSYLQTSIFPKIVSAQTGLTSFNYSTNMGYTILFSYFILKNVLKANENPPKYVFIEYHYPSWTLEKEYIQREFITALYDFKSHVGEFYDEFGLAESVKMFIPSLKHQESIRKMNLRKHLQTFKLRHYYNNTVMAKLIQLDGTVVLVGDPEDLDKEPFQDRCKEGLYPSPIFQKYFERILKLTAENGIKAYFIMLSEPPKWQKLAERCDHFQPFENYLGQLSKIYPNLKTIDTSSVINDNKYFYNVFHLNIEGIKALSHYIADVINNDRHSAGDRDIYWSGE